MSTGAQPVAHQILARRLRYLGIALFLLGAAAWLTLVGWYFAVLRHRFQGLEGEAWGLILWTGPVLLGGLVVGTAVTWFVERRSGSWAAGPAIVILLLVAIVTMLPTIVSLIVTAYGALFVWFR